MGKGHFPDRETRRKLPLADTMVLGSDLIVKGMGNGVFPRGPLLYVDLSGRAEAGPFPKLFMR
jgi:hypothetical protein